MTDKSKQTTPTKGDLAFADIASFVTKAGELAKQNDPTILSCSMGPGLDYPEGWEYCIGGTVFVCSGGAWRNTGRSC